MVHLLNLVLKIHKIPGQYFDYCNKRLWYLFLQSEYYDCMATLYQCFCTKAITLVIYFYKFLLKNNRWLLPVMASAIFVSYQTVFNKLAMRLVNIDYQFMRTTSEIPPERCKTNLILQFKVDSCFSLFFITYNCILMSARIFLKHCPIHSINN